MLDLVDGGARDPRHRVVAVVEPPAARLEHAADVDVGAVAEQHERQVRRRRTGPPRPRAARAGRASDDPSVTSSTSSAPDDASEQLPAARPVGRPVEEPEPGRGQQRAAAAATRGAGADELALAATGQRHHRARTCRPIPWPRCSAATTRSATSSAPRADQPQAAATTSSSRRAVTANGRPAVSSSNDRRAAASTSGRPDTVSSSGRLPAPDHRRALAERGVGDRAPHAPGQLGEHVHPVDGRLDREVGQQRGPRARGGRRRARRRR